MSKQSRNDSSWWQKLLLRDQVNGALNDSEPWKLVVGTLGAAAASYCAVKLYTSEESVFDTVGRVFIKGARAIPGVEGQIQAQTQHLLDDLERDLTVCFFSQQNENEREKEKN
jgi:hypothetical protein